MAAATLLAITIVPVLCTFLVSGPFRSERDNWIMKRLLKVYEPVLDWALSHRFTVLGSASALLVIALVLAFGLPRALGQALAKGGWPRAARLASTGGPIKTLCRAGLARRSKAARPRAVGTTPCSTTSTRRI